MTISIGVHASHSVDLNTNSTPARNTQVSGSTIVLLNVAVDNGTFNPVLPTVSGTINGVPDGNTYTQIDSIFGPGSVFYCENAAGGNTHVFTASTGGTFCFASLFMVEIIGGIVSGILDRHPGGVNDTTSPYATNFTGMTAQANELLLAFASTASSSGTEVLDWTLDSFLAIDAESDASAGTTGGTAYKIVSSVGSYLAEVTSTGAGTAAADMFIFSFKDASGGGGAPSTGFRLNGGILMPDTKILS